MTKLMRFLPLVLLAASSFGAAPIKMTVDFSEHIRDWDGFGVNYVEASQTRDYKTDPQEYGGFSLLSEQQRQDILEMTFGPDGLKPGLLKMFLDPFHEEVNDNDDPNVIRMAGFDHTTTTKWLRYFAREGLARTRQRGADLAIITTLYGPPAWTTKQKFIRGRDLDPEQKYEVAEYIISWVKYLREVERVPVKYISLHNEGEDYARWPEDGSTADRPSHDYNMYWPPAQVVEFVKLVPGMLARQGLSDVAVTPGETSNWYRFSEWGYAHAIASDPAAARNLGLITSHGFVNFKPGRWFADWRSVGNDVLREKNPGLHSWVTSQSWGQMDADFVNVIRGNIYAAKVNGVIPWAVIQRPAKWVGGDPNPGTAFRVDEQGGYTVQPGYYFYKQVSRAGQPGMAVAYVSTADSEVGLIAFAKNGTANRDAFVAVNFSKVDKPLAIRVAGTTSKAFQVYRTSAQDRYRPLGEASLEEGLVSYSAPAGSVTTFFGK